MNKLNSGNPITIKINGEKRPYVEEPSKEETQSNLNEDLPIEHDTSKLEHEVIEETAAAQEAEESFDWILPQQETIQNDSSLYQAVTSKRHTGIRLPALSKVEKKNISAIKSMALSVVFAILLGTGFGFIMLKLVITDGSKPAAVETKPAPAAKKETAKTTNNISKEAITLKPLTTYMIQGGVFSKKETAKAEALRAVEKGIPAETMEWNGQYYIFLGVADSIEHARNLGAIYQRKGMDGVFPKTIKIPEKKISNLSTVEKNVVENAAALAPFLATLSSNALIGEAITSSERKALSEFRTKLNKIDSKGIKNQNIKDLSLEISGALKQIDEYQQQKDRKLLVKAQQHLLTFMAEYYSY